MNIAAVVIWYNPNSLKDNKAVSNICSYASRMGKVFIIDNSQDDNSALAQQIPQSQYFSNKNKGGIAGAQNQGCRLAFEQGFQWVMTMDQDSNFDPKTLDSYLNACKKQASDNTDASSFTLNIYDTNRQFTLKKLIRFKILSPLKRFILRKKDLPPAGFCDGKSEYKEGDIEHPVMDVIASANIIKLSVWKELNGFDEKLFIDYVDIDYTLRQHIAGYKIIRFKWLFLIHAFGDAKIRFYNRKTNFMNDFRLFYVFRNNLYMQEKYPDYIDYFKTDFDNYYREYCRLSIKFLHYRKILRKAKKAFLEMKKTEEK